MAKQASTKSVGTYHVNSVEQKSNSNILEYLYEDISIHAEKYRC